MIHIEKLSNGLIVLVEEIPHAESAAYDLFIPGGIVRDSEGTLGSSIILAELTSRGTQEYDSRQLSDAFDAQGIRHSESAGHDKFIYQGSLLGEHLPEALRLVSQMVQTPTLPEDEIESIRSIFIQDIRALEDNPSRKALVELARRYYPDPWGRSNLGTEAGLNAVTRDHMLEEWEEKYRPNGAVFSVAGKVNASRVVDDVKRLFGAWSGDTVTKPVFGALPPHETFHLDNETAQLQIALAYPSAPFGDRDYYVAKVATGILSGGMFGRLFIEVREKRGLCYSVYARHAATNDFGTVTVFAGTTPERSHETLEVTLSVLRTMGENITEEELSRAKANMLSSLVIGEESTASRASSNAGDWWLQKRIRTLDEIRDEIQKVTVSDIQKFVGRFPSDSFMLLTLGSRRLEASNQHEVA